MTPSLMFAGFHLLHQSVRAVPRLFFAFSRSHAKHSLIGG